MKTNLISILLLSASTCYSLNIYAQTGNTKLGESALANNTTGSFNTALGYKSINLNTSGSSNTAVGYKSLISSTRDNNTAIGYKALYNNITGQYNTALGYGADVGHSDLKNATALGYGAIVDHSNKVRIGNDLVTSIGGKVGWTTFSDGRYKKDIKENVPGLEFIKSLRPVTYTINIKGLNEYHNKGRNQVSDNEDSDNTVSAELKKAEDAAGKIVYSGLIAQEVEEAAKKLNFEFSGVDKPQSKDGLYGLRYDNFIVPLVKAVQELSRQNEDLQKQINELKARETANVQSDISSQSSTKITLSNASLEQNTPNPFNSNTAIRYNIPASISNAQILITNASGNMIKTFTLNNKGAGSVTIKAGELAAGNYYYTLIVDGKKIDSKQMVLIK